MADGGAEALAATGLANVLGLAGDGLGGDVAAVAVGVGGGDGLLVKLGEEDVGDGVVDGLGGGFEEVGEADVQAAFAEADGGVEGGEAAEADVEGGHRRAGAEFAVLVLEDGDEAGGGCGRLDGAGLFGGGADGVLGDGGRGDRQWSRGEELHEQTHGGGFGILRSAQRFSLLSLLSMLREEVWCLFCTAIL